MRQQEMNLIAIFASYESLYLTETAGFRMQSGGASLGEHLKTAP
jgi:hypothetical protein